MPKLVRKAAQTTIEKTVEAFIRTTLDENGVDSSQWTINFFDSKSTLGLCASYTKTITISRVTLTDKKVWRNTALHEVAHALLPHNTTHNEEWKTVARRLGATPKSSTHMPDTTENKSEGKKELLSTPYGDVQVVYGETQVKIKNATYIVVAKRSNLSVILQKIGDTSQKRYVVKNEFLHENFGKIDGVIAKSVSMRTNHGLVKLTLGESKITFDGKTYTAYEKRTKNVLCYDNDNARVIVPAHYFHPNMGMLV